VLRSSLPAGRFQSCSPEAVYSCYFSSIVTQTATHHPRPPEGETGSMQPNAGPCSSWIEPLECDSPTTLLQTTSLTRGCEVAQGSECHHLSITSHTMHSPLSGPNLNQPTFQSGTAHPPASPRMKHVPTQSPCSTSGISLRTASVLPGSSEAGGVAGTADDGVFAATSGRRSNPHNLPARL